MKRIISSLGVLVLIIVALSSELKGLPPTVDLNGLKSYNPTLGVDVCECPQQNYNGCYCRITTN